MSTSNGVAKPHNNGTRQGFLYGSPQAKKAGVNSSEKKQSAGTVKLTDRDFAKLDWIHFAFLGYSAAHNCINAFHRADNFLFFLFVLVGILCVEWMLWCVYQYYKAGMLIGAMKKVGLYAGMIAMFYATAGILAQAQGFTGSAWLDFHYAWIMPTSAPVMFVFAFWIQAIDPIMESERDASAYQYLVAVDERREKIDLRRSELDERKQLRALDAKVKKKKIDALKAEAEGGRTRRALKRSAVAEMPYLLLRAGVKLKKANDLGALLLQRKYDLPTDIEPDNPAINPRSLPGAHEKNGQEGKG